MVVNIKVFAWSDRKTMPRKVTSISHGYHDTSVNTNMICLTSATPLFLEILVLFLTEDLFYSILSYYIFQLFLQVQIYEMIKRPFFTIRWHNHLNPDIKREAWTLVEELALMHAHRMHGNKWAEIAKALPGRYPSYLYVFIFECH